MAGPGIARAGLGRALVAAGLLSLGACAAVGPALTSLAVAVGQDLLSSAAMNHTDRYAQQLDHLFVTMARELTRLPMQSATERGEVLSTAGYGTPGQGGYNDGGYNTGSSGSGYGNDSYDNSGYDNGAYNSGTYDGGYQQQTNDPYGQQSGGYEQSGSYDQSGGYDQSATYDQSGSYDQQPTYDQGNPYDQNAGYDQASGYDDTNPYSQSGGYDQSGSYDQNTGYDASGSYEQPNPYGSSEPTPAYGAQVPPVVARSAAPISLSLALLKAALDSSGREALVPVNDGDTLYDGNGVPDQGDRLKFLFQANCSCYVYLVGVDTTGYVASIFPDPDVAFGNPVNAGQQYQLPPANDWWGLDRNKGIEHVYVVVSRQPRNDIAQAIATLRTTPAGSGGGLDGQLVAVAEPYVRQTRGLVKVQSSGYSSNSGTASNAPTPVAMQTFSTPQGADDLLMTRWFRHQ